MPIQRFKSYWAILGGLIAVAVSLAAPRLASAEDPRIAVPSESAQAEAMKLAKDAFGADLAGAKTAEQKIALATKLLKLAAESEKEPAQQLVMLKLARDAAIQGGSAEAALGAVDQMAARYDIDGLAMKIETLQAVGKMLRSQKQSADFVTSVLHVVDDAVTDDEFESAAKICESALPASRKAGDPSLSQNLASRTKEIRELAKGFADVKKSREMLKLSPADPAANLNVGKYYCFTKGSWSQGLPMLAAGNDPKLKELAAQDLAAPTVPAEQAKLGDGWWDLAATAKLPQQLRLQERAGYWYKQAAPGLTGVSKAMVDKRLRAIATTTVVDILPQIDATKDAMEGIWVRNGSEISCNEANTLLKFPPAIEGNYELTVDFTRTSGSRAIYMIFPVGDRVGQITLSNRNGAFGALDPIDHKYNGIDGPTAFKPCVLRNGQRYSLMVRVQVKGDDTDVNVFLDKQRVIHWPGKLASLEKSFTDCPLPEKHAAFGAVRCPAILQKAQFRLLPE